MCSEDQAWFVHLQFCIVDGHWTFISVHILKLTDYNDKFWTKTVCESYYREGDWFPVSVGAILGALGQSAFGYFNIW